MADAETESYVDGVGVHWYQDWYKPASLLNDAHEKYPDKFILNTEACEGKNYDLVSVFFFTEMNIICRQFLFG